MRMRIYVLSFLFMWIAGNLFAQSEIYVAPTGSASSPGTISSPTTLERAITSVVAGGTIYMRAGTYKYSSQVTVIRGNDGTSNGRKKIFAYTNEKVILDFSSQPYSAAGGNARGFQINAHYWHVKGLEVKGAADNGIYVAGNNNIIEQCITHSNKDSGLQLGRHASTAGKSEWPSNNLILNCDSYDNFDPDNGEDADGFACKLTTGPGNIFKGCHAWNNVDDGWDLYTKPDSGPIDPVIFENCVASNNGATSNGTSTSNSDGNGFKLGGEKIAVNHSLTRCVAFNNKKHGFTFNSNPGSIKVTNNTSFKNGQSNFQFDAGTHVFTNNLSYKGTSADKTVGTDVSSSNVWWKNASTNGKGLIASDADFASLTPTISRNADGSLNLGRFLHLASGSDLINSGVAVSGGNDIGAFEFGGTTPPATYTLTVNAAPSAGGTITQSPSSSTYNAGASVTLTAVPASGYTFTGWSGDASGSSATVAITMNANKTVTANFTTSVGTPSIALSTTAGNAQVALSWTVSNATLTSQEIYRDIDSNPSGRVKIASIGSAVRTYSDNSVQNGTTYYYWIVGTTSSAAYNSNASLATPQGTTNGGSTTIRIEDASTIATGYCGAGGSRQSSYKGADNGYYINLSNSAGKGIDWKVSTPATGSYTLKWRYANSGSSSSITAKVLINSATAVASISFPKTANWSTWSTATATVTLAAGVNTIRLETIGGGEFANIDWIEITGNSPAAASCNSSTRTASADINSEEVLSESMVSYPNPASTTLNIQIPEFKKLAAIHVLNATGKTVLTTNASEGNTQLDLSGLSSGLYVLKVLHNGKLATRHFFVK